MRVGIHTRLKAGEVERYERYHKAVWPEVLAAFTGEKDIDASAIRDYFEPLNAWLGEQNRGKSCGW